MPISEIVGQKSAVVKILSFLTKFKKGKALLLYGPPGVGKTFSIHKIAEELNYQIVELTAEDLRNKDFLSKFESTISTASLFGKKRMILIDELESLAKDRGLTYVIKLIKESPIPIVLIALDYWSDSLKSIRPYVSPVEFKKIDWRTIKKYLESLALKKGIKVEDEKIIEYIARNSKGDLRAAIIDFNLLAAGKKEITFEDLDFIEERSYEENVFGVLKKIFQYQTKEEAYSATENSDIDPSYLLLWVSENVPNAYKNKESIACAFNNLSKADIFLSRINKTNNWSFLSYAMTLLSLGVSFCRNENPRSFIRYQSPSKIKKMVESKSSRKTMSLLLDHFSSLLHTSKKVVQKDYLPLFRKLAEKNKEFKEYLNSEFSISVSDLRKEFTM